MFEKVETGIAASKAPLSATVKSGPIVRSAHIAKNPTTGELITGDIETQARQVFLNLQQALEAAGGTLADVVQIQAYLTDKADAAGMNRPIGSFSQRPTRSVPPSSSIFFPTEYVWRYSPPLSFPPRRDDLSPCLLLAVQTGQHEGRSGSLRLTAYSQIAALGVDKHSCPMVHGVEIHAHSEKAARKRVNYLVSS